LEPLGLRERIGFVVNRAARSEITPGDVTRVFGVAPLAVVPFDRAVGRAQDHGRILPSRGRVGRAFDRLAATVSASRDEHQEAS
jgi:Flp pilus assembly CpaE family ATPase